VIALLCRLAMCGPALADESANTSSAAAGDEIIGLTAPFRSVTLASIHRGQIAALAVPEGGVVKKGELVCALDDRVQRARTEVARARAGSVLRVELAAAVKERADRELDRLVTLHGENSASSKELRDARVDAEVARLEYEVARFDHEQEIRSYEHERTLLSQYELRAPFTGYVVEHLKQVGETVNDAEGVVTLAQLDPLLVSIDCPLRLASSVRQGDRLWVRPVDSKWAARAATVTLASRVADGASQTFRVKLSVDNGDAAWVSGLKVVVELPATGHAQGGQSAGLPKSSGSTSVDGRQR
jgi:multidrug efflux system membrane fusion protein